MANPQVWVNPRQPQTLYFANILLYIDAVFLVLSFAFVSPLGFALLAGYVGGGWGIANEKRAGYLVAIVVSVLGLVPYISHIAEGGSPFADPIGLMFAVAQLALLLHPHSRDYQRIWFK